MKVFQGLIAGVLAAFLMPAAAQADRAIIVLDGSGSMWGQIDGVPKLEIAREALGGVLQSLPADLELGLMAYGHRRKGDCADIELLVEPAAGTAGAIGDAAAKMSFLGKTPLSQAVREAAQSLNFTEDKATVVLITDGIETCEADPCALASELEASGIDFTAHVVGFGLTREEGRQVACLAENTGGRYIEAANSGELSDALTQTVAAAPEPAPAPAPAPQPAAPEFNFVPTTVLIAGSEPLIDGNVYEIYKARADDGEGDYVTTDYNAYRGNLEPGRYFVRARMGHAETTQLVDIEAGAPAEPQFVLDAGTLIIRPRGSEGGEIVDAAAVNIRYQPDGDTTYYGAMEAVFPKGELTVSVKIGEGQAVETIAMLPGETIERDIVVGVGRAVTNAYYVEGMKVDASGLAINLFKAAKRIDGTREEVTYAYGPDAQFDLPAGDYVAVARLDEASAEAPFSVKVGERVEADVVLGAGVAFINAEGASRIEIFSAAKNIQGERKAFGYAYDAQFQTTLPAGEYVAVATRADDAKSEAALTVKAGERAEITVP